MKRILIIFAMSLMSCLTAGAQEYKYEARLGWIPMDLVSFLKAMGEYPTGETIWGPVTNLGIFSADFDVKVNKWMSVGGRVNYRNLWRDMTKAQDGVVTNGIDRTEAMSIMPMIEFSSPYDKVLRCYANVGMGPGLYDDGEKTKGYFAFQCTPLGIAIGKKISWYVELGVGNAYAGLFTGLSWRF